MISKRIFDTPEAATIYCNLIEAKGYEVISVAHAPGRDVQVIGLKPTTWLPQQPGGWFVFARTGEFENDLDVMAETASRGGAVQRMTAKWRLPAIELPVLNAQVRPTTR